MGVETDNDLVGSPAASVRMREARTVVISMGVSILNGVTSCSSSSTGRRNTRLPVPANADDEEEAEAAAVAPEVVSSFTLGDESE